MLINYNKDRKLHKNFTKQTIISHAAQQRKAHKIVKSKKYELEIKLNPYAVCLAVWNLRHSSLQDPSSIKNYSLK